MNASTATPRLTAFPAPPRGDHRTPRKQLLPVRTAYTALAWVVVFFAFHVYWNLGGSFGVGGEGYVGGAKLKVVGWIVEVLALAAFPLGAWACLAIARGWPHGKMQRAAAIVVWLGCTVLVLRGGAGLIDDVTRAAGLLPNGITGLSHKQTMGAAYYQSASAIWSANITDGYFLAGGIIFGLLGWRYRPARSQAGRVRADHGPAILAFEQTNRAYFAEFISDRGDDFYAQFAERFRALLAEQESGACVFYLLVDEDEKVMGRFNLYDLADGTAEVGYRVAQQVADRGVATSALQDLCRMAREQYGLRTLQAATDEENIASQRVLTKVGFIATGPTEVSGRRCPSYELVLTCR